MVTDTHSSEAQNRTRGSILSSTHSPGAGGVKKRLDQDLDDVFNFAAQEKNAMKSYSRQFSNPGSSVGNLGNSGSSSRGHGMPFSLSADNLERLQAEKDGTGPRRPTSISRSFAQEFHESVLQSTRQKEMLRASSKLSC